MIEPVNVSDVVAAVILQLKEHPSIANYGADVELVRSGQNEDPNMAPWLSVYRFGVNFPPRSMANFRYQKIRLAIACQEAGSSGEECEMKLEKLVQAVMTALISDPSLRGMVQALDEEIDVQYPDYTMNDNQYMQTAIIQFTGITVVGGI